MVFAHSLSPTTFAAVGGPEGRRSRRPPSSCSVGGRRQEVWELGHLRPVLDVAVTALSLSPLSTSSLDGALNDGFGEGVMPHDVAKPRQLPPPDGCQERLLRTHKLRT